MSWVFFAFLAALLTSATAITNKKILFKEHSLEFATMLALFVAALSVPLLVFADFSSLTIPILGIMYTNSFLGAQAYLLITKSLRHMEISDSAPLLTFGPVFTAIIAFIVLGEALTLLQLGGLALLLLGAFLLETKFSDGIFSPFRRLASSKYVRYIFLALFLYGFCATLDKVLLGHPSEGGLGIAAQTYIPIVNIMIALNFIFLVKLFHKEVSDINNTVKNAGKWILLAAVFTIGYRFAQGYALTFIGVKVALVSAIKRTSSFFSTVFGGELFHEHNLLQKGFASAIMVAGSVLIIL